MIHCLRMSTVTIPKREYEALKKDAGAWRKVMAVNRSEVVRTLNRKTFEAIQSLRIGKGKEYVGGTKQIFDTLVNGKKGVAKKRLPAGLRQALREVAQGKLSGPFNSVEEFMADLKR